MVAQTSLLAYREVEPKLGSKQKEVLQAISVLMEACNEDIAVHLDWPINTVTGRVNELRKAKQITISDKRKNIHGRTVQYYRVVEEKEMAFDCE